VAKFACSFLEKPKNEEEENQENSMSSQEEEEELPPFLHRSPAIILDIRYRTVPTLFLLSLNETKKKS